MKVLEIQAASKSYGKRRVLKDIHFSIDEPSIVALVGPNGSGKTTLLNAICHLIRLDRGEISVFGINHRSQEIFRKCSYLQDQRVLYTYLSGRDHLEFIARCHRLSPEKIEAVIDRLGIRSYIDRRVKVYSLGMKQHLLIAMAILPAPSLILMDEPLNGLDPSSTRKVRDIFLEEYRRGTSIFIASHILSEVDRLTQHIVFMKEGQLLEPKQELQHLSAQEQYEAYFMSHDGAEEVERQ